MTPMTDSNQPAMPAQTSGFAITSFICSLIGVWPAGIVLGHIALSQIRKSAGQLSGHGLALAGTILGYVWLTVFIVLSAISVLFVGARAWKKGSDRSACIMNVRNVQQAIRGHQSINGIDIGAPINWDVIFGPDGYLDKPSCPIHGEYEAMDVYPPDGETAFKCTGADHALGPEFTANW